MKKPMLGHRTVAEAMRDICGDEPAIYRGDVSGESAVATEIRDLLCAAEFATLTGEQLDHLGRVLSAGMAGVWGLMSAAQGWRVRKRWRATRHTPAAREHTLGSGRYYETDHGEWNDHLTTHTNGVRTLYEAEPYRLTEEGLRELLAIAEQGWHITIEASYSTHFPGHTMRVRFERRPHEVKATA